MSQIRDALRWFLEAGGVAVRQLVLWSEGDTAEALDASPRVASGRGAPTHPAPDGSVFVRRDGTAGTTLYVRTSGAWAVASGTDPAIAAALIAATSGTPAALRLFEATANGTRQVSIVAPADLTSDRTVSLPDANVDLGAVATAAGQVAGLLALPLPTLLSATFTADDLDAEALSQDLVIGPLPAGATVLAAHLDLQVGFDGGEAASVAVEVGIDAEGGEGAFIDSTSIFAGADLGRTSGDATDLPRSIGDGIDAIARVTADVDVALLTTGQFTVHVVYLSVPISPPPE